MPDPVIWTTKKSLLTAFRSRMKGVNDRIRSDCLVSLTVGYDGLTLDNGTAIPAEVADIWHGAKFSINGFLLKQLLNRLTGECIVLSFQPNYTLRLESGSFRVDLFLPLLELPAAPVSVETQATPEPVEVATPAQPAKTRPRRPTKRFQNVQPVYTVPTAVFAKTGGI